MKEIAEIVKLNNLYGTFTVGFEVGTECQILFGGMIMAKAMVIINPTSGKEQGMNYKQQLEQQLCDTYTVTIMETQQQGDATRFARQACDEQYELIVFAGGDGTVHEGIEGIAEQPYRPIVGVIPLGTVNDFARALQISLKPELAIQQLGGATKDVDLGKVNNHYFTNIIAIGALPQAVGEVSIEQKTTFGSLAYFFEGAKAAVANDTFTITLSYHQQTIECEAMLFLVALTNSVAGFRNVATDASVDDGLLHCYVLKAGSLFDTTRLFTALVAGDFSDDASVEQFNTTEVFVDANTALNLNIDGDLFGTLPAKIEVLPRHVTVFVGKHLIGESH